VRLFVGDGAVRPLLLKLTGDEEKQPGHRGRP
jgi:hypothetical protein